MSSLRKYGRLTAREAGYRGYLPAKVYLDGKEITGCTVFDDLEGWVEVYDSPDGKPALDETGDKVKTKILYGAVVYVPNQTANLKRAYLVLGPESSGTRLITRILIAGGCHGTDDHVQAFDRCIPDPLTPIVWRRSLPHGHNHEWPNIKNLIWYLINLGRDVNVVCCTRDMECTIDSQLFWGHVTTDAAARQNIIRAYREMFDGVQSLGVKCQVVSYESLIAHPRNSQRILLESLGLDATEDTDGYVSITDENSKHTIRQYLRSRTDILHDKVAQ